MSVLSQSVIPYVRRIVKTSNEQDLPDSIILDYLNRFYQYDVPAELQLFDLKTVYSFQTIPLVDKYNAPILEYNMFLPSLKIDGVVQRMFQSRSEFSNWANFARQQITLGQGDGVTQSFTFTVGQSGSPVPPFIRAHLTINNQWTEGIFISALNSNNELMTIRDGLLPMPVNQNEGNLTEDGTNNAGIVNYQTGAISFTFSSPPLSGEPITGSFNFFQPGRPNGVLFFDNYFECRPVPNISYTIEMDAYKTPAAFLSTAESFPLAWMAEYMARGTAQKILSDVGDTEQFTFYEPLFRKQERYVLRRSSRQRQTQRKYTIFAAQAENEVSTNYRWY